MAYKINIRGVIDSEPLEGSYYPSLLNDSLIEANGDDLIIDIDSVGGCVNTGVGMYAKIRRYAKEHNANVTTRADGFVASIATIIFLSGDRRVVNEFMQPFVHEPWITSGGNASTLMEDAKSLESTQNIMAKFYAEHTNISVDEALQLMKDNTWMDAEYCLEIGFATEIEKLNDNNYKLVANIKQKLNNKKMNKNNSTWFAKVSAILTNHKSKAMLELADVSGNSIVFPELEEGDVPKEGDKITVDGDENYSGAVETNDYVIEVAEGLVASVVDKNAVDQDEIIEELIEIIENLEDQVEAKSLEVTKMKKVMETLRSAGNPDSKKSKEEKATGKTSTMSASIQKIRERNKNKK